MPPHWEEASIYGFGKEKNHYSSGCGCSKKKKKRANIMNEKSPFRKKGDPLRPGRSAAKLACSEERETEAGPKGGEPGPPPRG